MGKTLREFQPTIKELQVTIYDLLVNFIWFFRTSARPDYNVDHIPMKEVSREFKSTLEREIGLDDIKDLNQSTFRPDKATATTSPSPSASSEDSLIKTDPSK